MYHEAVAMMTIAKKRRAEVDQARQLFRKPQSSENRKAKLDKLKQKLPCVCDVGKLGHSKDDNDCPAKVKVVNWEENEEQVTEEPHPFLVQKGEEQRGLYLIPPAPAPWLELARK